MLPSEVAGEEPAIDSDTSKVNKRSPNKDPKEHESDNNSNEQVASDQGPSSAQPSNDGKKQSDGDKHPQVASNPPSPRMSRRIKANNEAAAKAASSKKAAAKAKSSKKKQPPEAQQEVITGIDSYLPKKPFQINLHPSQIGLLLTIDDAGVIRAAKWNHNSVKYDNVAAIMNGMIHALDLDEGLDQTQEFDSDALNIIMAEVMVSRNAIVFVTSVTHLLRN